MFPGIESRGEMFVDYTPVDDPVFKEIPEINSYFITLRQAEQRLFGSPAQFSLHDFQLEPQNLLLSFLGKQKVPELPNPLVPDALQKFSDFLFNQYKQEAAFVKHYWQWKELFQQMKKNIAHDHLDSNEGIRERQYLQIAHDLYPKVQQVLANPSKTLSEPGTALSFLEIPQTPKITEEIDWSAAQKIDDLFQAEYDKDSYLYQMLMKWNSFKCIAEENRPYTGYNTEDDDERKKQFLTIANYLWLGIQEAQKSPSESREQILRDVSLVIMEDITECLKGVMSRIHHNYLPLCMQQCVSYALPIFPLMVVHRQKELAFRTTVEWATGSNIGAVDPNPEAVHAIDAFYQAENQREGLGFSPETLGTPEAMTQFLVESRGFGSSVKSYSSKLLANKDFFLSPKTLVNEICAVYKRLSPEEQEELLSGLLVFTKWKLSTFTQIFATLKELQDQIDTLPRKNERDEQERLQSTLESFGFHSSIHSIDELSFIENGTKNFLRHHIINRDGTLSNFGAALILQTAGLLIIPNHFPEEYPVEYKELLQQAKENADLENRLKEELRKKVLHPSQVPRCYHQALPKIEELRENPPLAYELSERQLARFSHQEKGDLIGMLDRSFRSIYLDLPVIQWPAILLQTPQFVLQKLDGIRPFYNSEITDCLEQLPKKLRTKKFFIEYAEIIARKVVGTNYYFFRWVPKHYLSDPQFVKAVHNHLQEVIEYIPWEACDNERMQAEFLRPLKENQEQSTQRISRIGLAANIYYHHILLNQMTTPTENTGVVAKQIHNIGQILRLCFGSYRDPDGTQEAPVEDLES